MKGAMPVYALCTSHNNTTQKKIDYKCKCVTQSSKAVWIDQGWTYHGRVLLGSFRVLMYNGRALLGPLRVLIYSGRVPSGPPPFGSSFAVVGSLRVLLGSLRVLV